MKARPCWLALLALAGALAAHAGDAGAPSLPGAGFTADRYAPLWTKSPFAIATPEAAGGSPEYALVGLAQFDGVSYATLVDRQSQEHFVVASDKPVRDLTLLSISHGTDGASATLRNRGATVTLRLENAPAAGANPGSVPFLDANRPIAGGPLPSVGGVPSPDLRPPARFHRPTITVPPRPQ